MSEITTKPCIGRMTTKNGRVRWSLTPDEARELADVLEEGLSSDDLGRQDVAALREAAEELQPDFPA